jgi:hypothetical protein
VVTGPGDGSRPLKIYECNGDPTDPNAWVGRNLLDRDMVHGHTLDIGDIDGDGNLDILTGEQGTWTRQPNELDNSKATTWILYGDGKGNFRTTVSLSARDSFFPTFSLRHALPAGLSLRQTLDSRKRTLERLRIPDPDRG